MGLLSSLQKAVLTPLAGTANLILSGLEKVTGKTYGRQSVEAAMQDKVATGLANVIIGGAVALGGVVAAPKIAAAVAAKGGTAAVVKSAAASLIPATAKGKIIAAVAAPIVVGAVMKEPTKSIQAVVKAPSELAQFGGDVATFAANPSLESAKEIIKESPLITTAATALGVIAVGKAVLPAIATAKQTGAIQEQTEAYKQYTAGLEQAAAGITKPQLISVTDLSTPNKDILPMTPQTQTLSSVPTGTKTRKRRARKAVLPAINQNVRVNVINSSKSVGISQTKRYINKGLLN